MVLVTRSYQQIQRDSTREVCYLVSTHIRNVKSYKNRGEYLTLYAQDESDTSEAIHVRLLPRDFYSVVSTGGHPLVERGIRREQRDSASSYDGGLPAPSNQIVIGTSQ